MSPPTASWVIGSPTTHTQEISPYTWGYSPTPYNPALQAPRNPQVQYRPLSWRTTLCRHFAKNRGWCPLGDDCNYIHDLALADLAMEDVRFPRPDGADVVAERDATRRGKAGTKHSHCWAYVQGLCHVKDCPYLHPIALHLFVRHTPCLAWPNCEKGALCPFKHPEPLAAQPSGAPAAHPQPAYVLPPSPPVMRYGAYPPYALHYYPYAAPISPTQPEPHPSWMPTYEGWVPSYHTMYGHAPGQPVSGSHERDGPIYEAGPPVVPAPYFVPAYPSTHYGTGLPAAAAPRAPTPHAEAPSYNLQAPAEPAPAQEQPPYVPPKTRRAGHARRISVTTVKSKEEGDALGLVSPTAGSEREGWKTHWAHRSWAPSTSSVHAASTPTLIY